MTRMYNPPHPGEVLRDGVFTGTGITVTDINGDQKPDIVTAARRGTWLFINRLSRIRRR